MPSPRWLALKLKDKEAATAKALEFRKEYESKVAKITQPKTVRNGVNSRTAMELMRHSDRKLTDKIYTDSNLLPTGEVIRNLPDDEPLTEILTEISGKTGQNGSNSVKTGLVKTEPRNRLEPASVQGLVTKRVIETLVEVAGIEPASRNLSDSASTYVVHLLI